MRNGFLVTLASSLVIACGNQEPPVAPPNIGATPVVQQPQMPPAQAGAAGSLATAMQAEAAPPIGNVPQSPAQGAAGALPGNQPNTPPAAPNMPPPAATPTVMQPMQHTMGECGLKTKYPGDEYCILPPPPDKGFQLHIGPADYDKPEIQYILGPGDERTSDFNAVSTNDKEVYFYYREYRMRTGAHHNIITSGGGGDSGLGQRIGTVNSLVEDYPKGGLIAPENEGVGIRMPAHTSINVSLHSINTSDKTMLRELWINFWYRPAEEVKQPVQEVFAVAPMAGIPPGADVTTKGSCSVSGTGRMLWAYGHRHANTVSFTVWRSRAGKKDLVYQGYSWEEPLVLDYSSTVKNAVPGDSPNEGGWSGILDVKSGDQFLWECHVINKTNGVLNFTNNTYSGEMCILDAEMVGASCR
jgi:hypothetical protein